MAALACTVELLERNEHSEAYGLYGPPVQEQGSREVQKKTLAGVVNMIAAPKSWHIEAQI